MISILIGHDQSADRTGLADLLGTADDLVLVGEASSPDRAVGLARELRPDVVLIDLSYTGAAGVAATRSIVTDHPDMHVLVLTSLAEPELVVAALTAGAEGYLLDNRDPEVTLAAIRELMRCHDTPPDPRVARVLLIRRRTAPPGVHLTEREWQVLRMVGEGKSNKEIGRRLGITERTVKAHLTHVYHRIHVADRTQAALWALRHVDEGNDEPR